MKTMGLADLRLISPKQHPAPESRAMASGARDVLEAATVHATLGEAIGDCVAAFAMSARPRERSPQVLAVRDAATAAAERAAQGPVAFVFGNEASGLTNEEMFGCQFLVHIPAADEYSSLNLAQAVQVTAYELRLAAGRGSVPPERREKLATVQDLEALYRHLDEAGTASGFFDPNDPKRLRERWRGLFSRVALEREEVNILRGLLGALMKGRDGGENS